MLSGVAASMCSKDTRWRWPRPASVRTSGTAAPRADPAGHNLPMKSAARVKLDRHGIVTVETEMTDILGICGAAAAVANAVCNATGVRVRDYPVTLDNFLDGLPRAA